MAIGILVSAYPGSSLKSIVSNKTVGDAKKAEATLS